ncbi:MAG: putative secreted protein [Herbinix sp.]|jgi:hypothetical protein|nr:putative secreted protein [Herbinix sp.]
MKRKRILNLVIAMMAAVLFMTACSSANKTASDIDMSTSSPEEMASNTSTDDGKGKQDFDTNFGGMNGSAESEAEAPSSDTKSAGTGTSAVQSNEKIIRTFFMEVETQEFDSLISRINSDINRMGGYVESSDISGRSYSYENANRYGNIVARVPSDKVDEFVNTVDENANVVIKQESTENISLQYIETESKIETLQIEQERLYALLEKEDSLEDIIVLENRLSEIRYELQNHQSQLRYYDNKVAYSTITLSINEVEKLTPVSEQKETLGTRIKNGLGNTMYNLSSGFQNFFVWLIVNLPYLLIWGVIITIIVIVSRRGIKKYNAKKDSAPMPTRVDQLKTDWNTPEEKK